jgi:oligopeptide/dipeptide ABC transporter ATP-binding protein
MSHNLLEVRNLKKYFPIKGGVFWREIGNVFAVDDVSFAVKEGETLGLVGESGCGKTTLGRALINLTSPTSGQVMYDGVDIFTLKRQKMQTLRKNIQIIFQDPFESLNPRHTVGTILEEPFIIHRIGSSAERKKNVLKLLDYVGLSEKILSRFPHEFSGGQRQRIGIARALALHPKLIICDEPVSALDVSIQAQIINLLLDLQQHLKLTYLFITHDLAVVRHVSDRMAVMYLGKIVEMTDAAAIYEQALHPYTQALMAAIPIPGPNRKRKRIILRGEVPSASHPPAGCRFHTRCLYTIERCQVEEPALLNYQERAGTEHLVACHRVGEI